MFNDLPTHYRHQTGDHEAARNAYNAAFHELGLRWFWDSETYSRLIERSQTPEERLRHYLEQHQPHLLRAYDAEFLVAAIQQKQVQHHERAAAHGKPCRRPFDWAETLAGELGA